eukprot:g1041.t1
MDADNDGSLNVNEIRRHLGDEYASHFMSYCDGKAHSIKDGLIDMEEWTDYFEYVFFGKGKEEAINTMESIEEWIRYSASDGRRVEVQGKAKNLFRAVDRDDSSEVDMEELHHFFGWDNAKRYLESTDKHGDGNGTVSCDEWLAYFDYLFDNDGYEKALEFIGEIQFYVNQKEALMKPISLEQKGIVKRAEALFYKLDKNHDRELTLKELTIFVGKANAEMFMTHMDHFGDCNGRIDISEWSTYFRSICIMQSYKQAKAALDTVQQYQEQKKAMEGDNSMEDYQMIERVDKVFQHMDSDGDGHVNLDELALCFGSDEAKDLIRHVDVWGEEDGVIVLDEWRGYFREMRSTQGHEKAMDVLTYVESNVKKMRKRVKRQKKAAERQAVEDEYNRRYNTGNASESEATSRPLMASFDGSTKETEIDLPTAKGFTSRGGGGNGLTLMEIMDLDLGNARAELVSMNKSHFRDREQWVEESQCLTTELEASKMEIESSIESSERTRTTLEEAHARSSEISTSKIELLEATKEMHEREIAALRIREHEHVNTMKVEHQEHVTKFLDEHSSNQKNAYETHQQLHTAIEEAHENFKEVERLRADDAVRSDKKVAELDRSLVALEAEIEAQNDALGRAKVRAEMNEKELATDYRSELASCEKELAKARSEYESLMENQLAEIESCKASVRSRIESFEGELEDARARLDAVGKERSGASDELSSFRSEWKVQEAEFAMQLRIRDSEAVASLANVRQGHTEAMARAKIQWHEDLQRAKEKSASAASTKDEASAMLMALQMSHDQVKEYKDLYANASGALSRASESHAEERESLLAEHASAKWSATIVSKNREGELVESHRTQDRVRIEEIESLRSEVASLAEKRESVVEVVDMSKTTTNATVPEEKYIELARTFQSREQEWEDRLRRSYEVEHRETAERVSAEAALVRLNEKEQEVGKFEAELVEARETFERSLRVANESHSHELANYVDRFEATEADLREKMKRELAIETEEWILSQKLTSEADAESLHALREDYERQLIASSNALSDLERRYAKELNEARSSAKEAIIENDTLSDLHRSEMSDAISDSAKRFRAETAAYRLRWASKLESMSGTHSDNIETQRREALLEQLQTDADKVELRAAVDLERRKREDAERDLTHMASQMSNARVELDRELEEAKKKVEGAHERASSTSIMIDRLKKVSAMELRRINEAWKRKFAASKLDSEKIALNIQHKVELRMNEKLRKAEEAYRAELEKMSTSAEAAKMSHRSSFERANRELIEKMSRIEQSHESKVESLVAAHHRETRRREEEHEKATATEQLKRRRREGELEREFRLQMESAAASHRSEVETLVSVQAKQMEEIRKHYATLEAQKRASLSLLESVKEERATSAIAMTSLRRTEQELAATTALIENEKRRVHQWPLRPLKKREEREVRIREMERAFHSSHVNSAVSSPRRRLAQARARALAMEQIAEVAEHRVEEEVARANTIASELEVLRGENERLLTRVPIKPNNGDGRTVLASSITVDSVAIVGELRKKYEDMRRFLASKELEWKERESQLVNEVDELRKESKNELLGTLFHTSPTATREAWKASPKSHLKASRKRGGGGGGGQSKLLPRSIRQGGSSAATRYRNRRPIAFWNDEKGWSVSGTSTAKSNAPIFLERA